MRGTNRAHARLCGAIKITHWRTPKTKLHDRTYNFVIHSYQLFLVPSYIMITMLNHRAHTDIGLASLLLQGDHGQIAFESSSIYRDRDARGTFRTSETARAFVHSAFVGIPPTLGSELRTSITSKTSKSVRFL